MKLVKVNKKADEWKVDSRRWQCFDVRTNTSGIDDKGGAKLLLTTQQTKRDWIQQEPEEPHNEPAKWLQDAHHAVRLQPNGAGPTSSKPCKSQT